MAGLGTGLQPGSWETLPYSVLVCDIEKFTGSVVISFLIIAWEIEKFRSKIF